MRYDGRGEFKAVFKETRKCIYS